MQAIYNIFHIHSCCKIHKNINTLCVLNKSKIGNILQGRNFSYSRTVSLIILKCAILP